MSEVAQSRTTDVVRESSKKEISWASDRDKVVAFRDGEFGLEKVVVMRLETTRYKSPAQIRKERGEAYREASKMLKESRPKTKRRRKRKEPVDRLSPEPGRYAR